MNINIVKHVNDITGFVEAYEEVYESVRKKQQTDSNEAFILMRAYNVVDEFEQRYNVNLIKTEDNNSSVEGMVFSFDSVDFKTVENQTMCLLKWT
jgi:predicted unusual protein kinase regulating ubiquinone biosynthesis (AarF/ABC1/UbiB family)